MTSLSKRLHLDFETESECDLKLCGVYKYAKHLSTKVHCLGYAFDDEPAEIWIAGEPFPQRIIEHIANGLAVYAHNATFELCIYHYVLRRMFKGTLPVLRISQTYCTMSQALVSGLPGALDKVATFLNLGIQKDMVGKRAMMRLMRPPKSGKEHKAEDFPILYDYCKTDVKVEREIEKYCPELDPEERNVWLDTIQMNSRGIRVDLKAAKKALEVVVAEKEHIRIALRALTNDRVKSPDQVGQLTAWCQEILGEANAILVPNVKKETVAKYLKNYSKQKNPSEEDTLVFQALTYRENYAKSATNKINSIIHFADSDEYIRGMLLHYGANTGRFAGRGVQIQNFFKPPYDENECERIVETVIELLHSDRTAKSIRDEISAKYGDVLTALASITRSLLIADEGYDFCSVDWSNIEGRVLAWLAGEDWKTEAFRLGEVDLYKLSYSKAFNVALESVTQAQRGIGKTQELAFGFSGSVGAWRKFDSKVPYFTDYQILDFVGAWRYAHPKSVKLWKTLERAAISAVKFPGTIRLGSREDAPVIFFYDKERDFLIMQLPSGRQLSYPRPRLVEGKFGEQVEYEICKKNGKTKKVSFWRGMIVENAVQAIAADILRFALKNMKESGYQIRFHVHDEIVALVKRKEELQEIISLMCKLPEWATGLPLAATGWVGPRYKKD